ncbi:uncharacterized protein LOC106171534 isoform X2 [Lingula anatina]|uniref:Uncharacterized protein LOC106171534 isoform X2 n=1 Tax=Lingula anatina TaxID=7574 RepID=A0A1S3JAN3_LINAN|nr:uncharacterized protein LOC106171534 isoform X2 [Lingula anatina]|eukprot:XP_013407383.1 uncharacterized protein LOC106171534 isoform X2 [Lingula anatina]
MALESDLIGVLVGGVIGGVILIIVLILLCYLACRPKSKQKYQKHRQFYDPGSYLPSVEPSLVHGSVSSLTKPHHGGRWISSDPYGGSLPTGMNRWGSNPGMYAVGPNPAYQQFHRGFHGFENLERGKAHSEQRLDTLGVSRQPVRRANSSMLQPPPGKAFYQARSPFVPLETNFETQLQETFISDGTIRDNSALFDMPRHSIESSSLGTPGSRARLLKNTNTDGGAYNFGYESEEEGEEEQEQQASPNHIGVVRPISRASHGTAKSDVDKQSDVSDISGVY